jgi:cytochrome o ubiquinol oxidase subunit 1
MPQVSTIDAFWQMKQTGQSAAPPPAYRPIEMPRNTPIGIIVAFFATIIGFSGIWHIWWLAVLGLVGVIVSAAIFGWSEDRETEITAAEVARLESARG